MKKIRSAISLIIIVFLGITSLICTKGILEGVVSRSVDSWLSDQSEIFTSQLTDQQKDELVAVLREYSAEHELLVVSKNKEPQQSGATLYRFSVLSSSNAQGVSLDPLVVLGSPIVNNTLIEKVRIADPGSYMGYGNDRSLRVGDLPSIRSGIYFRLTRLDSGADLGSVCKILGLDHDEFQGLVRDASSALGVNGETLTSRMSGSTSEVGLLYLFCAGVFVLLFIVLSLLMVTRSLLELKTLGIHLMLGWSRSDFASELLATQVIQLFVAIPIGIGGTGIILNGFTRSLEVVGFICATMLPTMIAVLVSAALAVFPLFSVKPVDAIRGHYSRHGFYVLIVVVYLLCMAAVFGGCVYIDQPLALYSDIARTRSAWNTYTHWYVVKDFSLEATHFRGNSMEFTEEMYAWYTNHADDEGVFLAKTDYYDETAIRMLLDGDERPEPFWYLAASPSYLTEIGVEIPDDLIVKARQGTRVYLLPESLDASEMEALEQLLIADHRPSDSNIVTSFMEKPDYAFTTYDGTKELFTWSTDAEQPVTTDSFVIAVVTPENMIPFESESLIATGLENDYVKLDERAASRLLDNDGGVPLVGSLDVRFTTVENYIDGLQKTLAELFTLFSVVLVMLMVSIVIVVACLIDVANRVSAREIAVKYVLGFGVWELYRREILFISLSTLVCIGVSVFVGSHAGLLVGVALLAISNLIIVTVVRKKSAAVVLETVSKEQ